MLAKPCGIPEKPFLSLGNHFRILGSHFPNLGKRFPILGKRFVILGNAPMILNASPYGTDTGTRASEKETGERGGAAAYHSERSKIQATRIQSVPGQPGEIFHRCWHRKSAGQPGWKCDGLRLFTRRVELIQPRRTRREDLERDAVGRHAAAENGEEKVFGDLVVTRQQ